MARPSDTYWKDFPDTTTPLAAAILNARRSEDHDYVEQRSGGTHNVYPDVIADVKTVADAAITSGSNQLSSTAAAFTSADAGKRAVVLGAGAPTSTTLSTGLTSGAGVTSLAVAALPAAIPPGGVNVVSGGNSQKFVTSGALAGATSIPLLGPVVEGLTAALSTGAPITSLPVASLNWTLPAGTVTIVAQVTAGVIHTQTFTTAGAAIGATSIPVTSATPNFAYPESTTVFGNPVSVNANFSYPIGSTVSTDVPALYSTISSVSAGVATLADNAGTTVSGAECVYATDNLAALNTARAAAEAVNGTLVLPDAQVGIYGTLASGVSMAIRGHGCRELYGGTGATNDANFPTVSPYLTGSVLVQMAPDADAIQLTARGVSQSTVDFGIRFAGKWQRTGHGIYNVAASGLGNIGGMRRNIVVYGLDGNHYALVDDSPELAPIYSLRYYGGGGYWLKTNTTVPGPPGNQTVVDLDGATFIAGIAQGLFIDGSGLVSLGMDSSVFINPELGVRIPSPALPNTTPPAAGASQNCITTFNAEKMTLFSMICPGGESDAANGVNTWPTGAGSHRTNDFNASFAKASQDTPTTGPTSGTAYRNLTGKPLIAAMEFMLQPLAAASVSTTLSALTTSGATSFTVTSATGLVVGQGIQIGTAAGGDLEFAIIKTIAGTTITVEQPGSFGLEIPHANGAAVNVGAAVVYAETSPSTTFPSKRATRWGAAIGTTPQHVSFSYPIPTSYYHRLTWANCARLWSDYAGSFG